MSRAINLAAALPERAKLALEIARYYDSECDATTAFNTAEAHPSWGIERLQKAIRSQTRRERGQRVFTPPWAEPKSDKLLTADLHRTDAQPEPFHLDDPSALVELFEFIAALEADPTARRRLALVDQQDELARRQAVLAAKALRITRRRAEQMRASAKAADEPAEKWAELVRRSATRAMARARRKKAQRARVRRPASPSQHQLFKLRAGRG